MYESPEVSLKKLFAITEIGMLECMIILVFSMTPTEDDASKKYP